MQWSGGDRVLVLEAFWGGEAVGRTLCAAIAKPCVVRGRWGRKDE